MKNSKNSWILIVIIFGLYYIGGCFGHEVEANPMNYSVSAVLPENQIDKNLPYFDLKRNPGQNQEIKLNIINSGDIPETIEIIPRVAGTNESGMVDYLEEGQPLDSSLKYPITTLLSEKQVVSAEPGEQKEAIFTLQMPQEDFQGVIQGGFYIRNIPNEEQPESKSTAMIIGIKLNIEGNKVLPDFNVNDIKTMTVNQQTKISMNVQNKNAAAVEGLKIIAKITPKNNSNVLIDTARENLMMAPNSNFDFLINDVGNKLKSGEQYTIKFVAKMADKTWAMSKNFKFETSEAVDPVMGNQKTHQQSTNNSITVYVSLFANVILTIIVGGLSYYIYKLKNVDSKNKHLVDATNKSQQTTSKLSNDSIKLSAQKVTKHSKKPLIKRTLNSLND